MIKNEMITRFEGDQWNRWLVVREVDVQKVGLTKNDFSHDSRTTVLPRWGSVFALDQDKDFETFKKACKQSKVFLRIQNYDQCDGLHQIRDWASIELIQDHAERLRAL